MIKDSVSQIVIPVLMGPTGSGKTAASVQLAALFPDRFEIVNCDSRQLYRGLEVTTAAPNSEELLAIPHHLVAVLEPDQETTAYDYRSRALQLFNEIIGRGRIPLMVVGTGFYFKVLRTNLPFVDTSPEIKEKVRAIPSNERLAMLRDLRPDLLLTGGGKIHENDAYRIERALELTFSGARDQIPNLADTPDTNKESVGSQFAFHSFYLDLSVDELVPRLNKRAQGMIDGMIQEIRRVNEVFGDCPGLRTLGADLVREFLAGGFSREVLIEKVWISHRQYAKRQRTWFRRETIERSGSVADFVAWVRLFVDPQNSSQKL